ncbi:hypothetical protein A1O3_04274 [Capronia epimyces CBS 606.96]|uniref:Uncharacterized protein n=1 Tax=Capronia epimyces CBS 606.96 TaxID=1182542 RepID=W9YCB5_9EURO|nr:uncharacterized protein A1O3_04274 [Capronia epimyces CBS 606.96]EXJ87315.1 hypothetical protein A1O3_04274 [Capronia epimyces CBS 606.96]
MNSLNIPPEGLVLQNKPRPDSEDEHSKEAQQVYRLDLVESVTKEILRSLRSNEQVRLRCGKRPAVQFGKRSIPLTSSVDPFPSELFTKSSDKTRPLYFSGRLSHRLEVQKAEEDTGGSDEALAALENTLRSIQEQRASNETSIVDGKETMRHARRKENKPSSLLGQNSALRKDHFLGGLARSTPSTPFLSASYSPRQGPTSAPSSSGLSPKDRIRLDAIRIPLVHLLAVKPMTPKTICAQLHCTMDDCEKLLDKVARECPRGDGLKELKEKTYRELDVFKFPYRSTEDRQSAIDHAIQAYDRMRVEKRDNLWQLLLPPDERGKGKVLSKLNFDKRVPSKPERQGDDSNETKAEVSERDQVGSKTKKDTLGTQKKLKDKAGASRTPAKTESNGTPRAEKESTQSQSKTTKQEGKFKSSERIEDSDEEADAVDVDVAKPKSPPSKTGSSMNRKSEPGQPGSTQLSQTVSPPKKASHKTSFSGSSSSTSSGNEKSQPAALNSTKSLKPHQKPDSSASRISPRPRHDSSPQKPSPLGSSPPTTSTDLDNSNSSKASNQSSAPSSPPSGTDMPRTQRGAGDKYSPVISDKGRNVPVGKSSDKCPIKRKAAPAEDERPAKRQQPTSAFLSPVPDGKPEHLKQPPPIRADSERSSSPDKPGPNRQDIIEEARRFQKYYKRYKDLYDKISQVDEKERDDKDMGDLWRMHKRLKEMKAEIWHNWDKVEKVGKARELLAV